MLIFSFYLLYLLKLKNNEIKELDQLVTYKKKKDVEQETKEKIKEKKRVSDQELLMFKIIEKYENNVKELQLNENKNKKLKEIIVKLKEIMENYLNYKEEKVKGNAKETYKENYLKEIITLLEIALKFN